MTTTNKVKNNLMLLFSYLSLSPYILCPPQINSENKPSLSEDALIKSNLFYLCSSSLINFTLFTISIINLLIQYLPIGRENIDLSMKNR